MGTKKNLGLQVAATIFGLVAVGHVLRLAIGFEFVFGSVHVPLWMSGVAGVVLGVLSAWLFKLSNRED